MKFTDENIEKAFEQAHQKLLNDKQYQGKTTMELLSDAWFIHQLDNLISAKELLQQLIDVDDMEWAKGKRELSDREMVDFIVEVAYDEAVSFWYSADIDEDWEDRAVNCLEFELSCITD